MLVRAKVRPHSSRSSRKAKSITTETQRPKRDSLTGEIIGAGIEVHRYLGPGLLESAYRECLCSELRSRGLTIARERIVPVLYKGARVDIGYRADLIVNERVLVELKSIERLAPIHTTQVVTYLKLSGLHVGLLINFNVALLRDGVVRIVL